MRVTSFKDGFDDGVSAQGLALRSQIVLACATGLTNKEVAARPGVSIPTVGKWRARFV